MKSDQANVPNQPGWRAGNRAGRKIMIVLGIRSLEETNTTFVGTRRGHAHGPPERA